MTPLIVLGLLFCLLALGTPVGFAMAFAGSVGLVMVGGFATLSGILQTAPLWTVSSYELITIAMFLLMADLVLLSGVVDDLFKTASAWVGRIPGGLGMATALAGAGFGAICGTSTASHVTQDLVAWIGALPTSRWVIIALILCGYIVLGSFMDQIAILVLTVPIVLPLIKTLGFDPIWFGVIKIVTAEVGMITPPVGLNCFIVARYAKRPVAEVFHGTFPHFIAHLIAIAILVAFPSIILWLPSQMGR
jgi:TRAP-type C4-dicarboxylate transport system permease large subunit